MGGPYRSPLRRLLQGISAPVHDAGTPLTNPYAPIEIRPLHYLADDRRFHMAGRNSFSWDDFGIAAPHRPRPLLRIMYIMSNLISAIRTVGTRLVSFSPTAVLHKTRRMTKDWCHCSALVDCSPR